MTQQPNGKPSAGKILITGGCGFIGSNLASHYLDKGWEVVAYDNFSRPGAESNAAWLEAQSVGRLAIILGDIRDYEPLCEAMQGVNVVAHLAAQVAVTSSVQDPREDFLINALGGFNVLEAARNCGGSPIVLYASTNKVYGALERVRVSADLPRYSLPDLPEGVHEAFPIDVHSPYGCSKGAIDLYMLDYARIYGLKTVVFRQSCIYGPRQFGIEDQGWVAHFVISAALGRPITIYGDGKQVRDILHVSDLIEAFERAIERIEVCQGQAYNLGGGPQNALSLLELIGRLEMHQAQQVAIRFGDWRPGDQKVYVSDVRKAQVDLGWVPTIGIERGLADLCAWVSGNRDLFSLGGSAGLRAEAFELSTLPTHSPGSAGLSNAPTLPLPKPQLSSPEPSGESSADEHPVLLPRLRAVESTARRMKAVTKESAR
ncbi:MAG: GDP-mannose 4,6-dehydratase [Anaerolineales bacterium]